jgi:hypothetical protein
MLLHFLPFFISTFSCFVGTDANNADGNGADANAMDANGADANDENMYNTRNQPEFQNPRKFLKNIQSDEMFGDHFSEKSPPTGSSSQHAYGTNQRKKVS